MLIPYGTDAPIYHYPIATVGTILLNVLLFIPVFRADAPYERQRGELSAASSDEDRVDSGNGGNGVAGPLDDEGMAAADRRHDGSLRWLTLELGRFNPLQWLTANYMHTGFMHLFGNMLFLWSFGLIIEGKIGWWKFLLVYNMIGVMGYGMTQLVLLGADDGISLGASLPIFGLIAMALIWAPANDLHCVLLLAFRVITFEASIATLAGVGVAWEAFKSGLQVMSAQDNEFGTVLTSEILHLTGAAIGAAIGFGMLFRNLVDCEGWDAISVWKGTHLKTINDDREDIHRELEQIKQMERAQRGQGVDAPSGDANAHAVQAWAAKPARSAVPEVAAAAAAVPMGEVLTTKFREFVRAGKGEQAREHWQRGNMQFPEWILPEADYVRLIGLLQSQKKWNLAVEAMHDYLLRYSEREITIRLALAQILIQYLNRPREAMEYVDTINVALLDARQTENLARIRQLLNARGLGRFKI